MFLLPILRIGLRKLRRQGLFFCVVVAGFLVSMATKPGPSEDPVIDPTPAVEYTITYADTKGCANANPTSYTVESGEIVFAPLTAPDGWTFLGWSPAKIASGSTGNQTVTAQWQEVQTPDPDPNPELEDLPAIISEVTGVPTFSKTVTYDGAGGINETKSKIDGCNVSSLKLTYTAKTGAFKGSFKVYTVVKGSLKNTTATVTGVVIDGIGHGMATIKKYGSFAVTIE